MPRGDPTIDGGREIRDALLSLARPPWLTLLLLSCFLSVVSVSIAAEVRPTTPDDSLALAQITSIVVDVIGIYVQIAVVLATASSAESSSGDLWMRAAFRHRCFWRFLAVTIVEVLLVLAGALVLVVGAFLVGGLVALSQPAVVLERRGPIDAIRRSAELARPARAQVTIVFGTLLLLPLVAAAGAVALRLDLAYPAQLAMTVGGSVLSLAAAIALTRAFVKLGGAPSPPAQALLYKSTRP